MAGKGNPAWKKGISGNPAGRPIGSRCKIELAFLDDCLANWTHHGAESIEAMRRLDVTSYCKMMASILPKHSEKTIKHDVQRLTDDELFSYLKDLRDNIGTVASLRGDGETPTDKAKLN